VGKSVDPDKHHLLFSALFFSGKIRAIGHGVVVSVDHVDSGGVGFQCLGHAVHGEGLKPFGRRVMNDLVLQVIGEDGDSPGVPVDGAFHPCRGAQLRERWSQGI